MASAFKLVGRLCDAGVVVADNLIDAVNDGAPKAKQLIGRSLDTTIVVVTAVEDAVVMAVTGQDDYGDAVNEWNRRNYLRSGLQIR